VRNLVDEGYARAKQILTDHSDQLENLARGLLEYETLTGAEISKVIAGQALNRGSDDDDADMGGNVPSVASIPKTKKSSTVPKGDMEPDPA
jgi:cell division protease FtsH